MNHLVASLLSRFRGLSVRGMKTYPDRGQGRLRVPMEAVLDVFEGFDGRVYAHLTFGHESEAILGSITGSGPTAAAAVDNLLESARGAGLHAKSQPGAEAAFRVAFGRPVLRRGE